MKYADIIDKNLIDLNQILADSKRELFNLRMSRGLSGTVNVSRFKVLRKKAAHVQTCLSARRIESKKKIIESNILDQEGG